MMMPSIAAATLLASFISMPAMAMVMPPLSAQQPTVSTWQQRLDIAKQYKVSAIQQRRFTQAQLWDAIAPALESPRLTVTEVGRSMQGRPLRTVTFGNGPIKVLLWSQMHGDEATATMALADIFAFLASPVADSLRDRLGSRLTVTFMPMLNPDGAEVFQRQNAAGIDINRDVNRLASPEARTLKSLRDIIQPDFGFNLHDQGARTRAGNGPQAAIALLAPAEEVTRSWSASRTRARHLAAWLATDFGNEIAGRIARYDDSYNPRAFGDRMQTWGVSTVLIESGALPGDPQKQRLRTLNAAAILGALDAIATGSYATADNAAYDSLPFNRGGAYDLLLTGGILVVPGVGTARVDVAINYNDPVARTGGNIAEVGDLSRAVAIDTINIGGEYLHPAAESVLLTGGSAWVQVGRPAHFTVRAGESGQSRELRRIDR